MAWGPLSVRRALPSDAGELAPRLREEDLEELRITTGDPALPSLERALEITPEAFAVIHTGRVAGLFGVAPDEKQPCMGAIWLLGAVELTEKPVAFACMTRDMLHAIALPYECVLNVVDARRRDSLAWLKWLGFHEFGDFRGLAPDHLPLIGVKRCATP